MQVDRQTVLERPTLEGRADAGSRQSTPPTADDKGLFIDCCPMGSCPEPGVDSRPGLLAHVHHPFLATLAEHGECGLAGVHGAGIDRMQLCQAQPAGIEQLDNRAIADVIFILRRLV